MPVPWAGGEGGGWKRKQKPVTLVSRVVADVPVQPPDRLLPAHLASTTKPLTMAISVMATWARGKRIQGESVHNGSCK